MPSSRPNISKSVGRAFAVLELFAQARKPLTAARLRESLNIPQPSLRALLGNLVELGYLGFDSGSRHYFPTARLSGLGDWIPGGTTADPRWAGLVRVIAADTGETTSLCLRRELRLEIVQVCVAEHPVAVQLRPGPGELLWRTAAGRTLLAAMEPAESTALLGRMTREASSAADRRQLRDLPAVLQQIRGDNSYIAYDLYLRGVGTVCLPTQAAGQAAVLAVAGASDRIRDRTAAILRSLRRQRRSLGED